MSEITVRRCSRIITTETFLYTSPFPPLNVPFNSCNEERESPQLLSGANMERNGKLVDCDIARGVGTRPETSTLPPPRTVRLSGIYQRPRQTTLSPDYSQQYISNHSELSRVEAFLSIVKPWMDAKEPFYDIACDVAKIILNSSRRQGIVDVVLSEER